MASSDKIARDHVLRYVRCYAASVMLVRPGWTYTLLILLALEACQRESAEGFTKRSPCLTVPPPSTLTQDEIQALEASKRLGAFLDYVVRLREWSQAAWVACGQEPSSNSDNGGSNGGSNGGGSNGGGDNNGSGNANSP
jgi:uncharacterized membrane protein YgcG